jgi:hypothetical protein
MRIDGHASVLLRMLLLCFFFLIMEQLAASHGTADRKRNPCSDHRLIRGHPTSGSVRQHRFPPFHTPGRWLICSALKKRTPIDPWTPEEWLRAAALVSAFPHTWTVAYLLRLKKTNAD